MTTHAGGLKAKILTVSDGVMAGTRDDLSGSELERVLAHNGFDVVERRCCADGADEVAATLEDLCRDFSGLVVTTGGTGFSTRDETPEGALRIIERQAPGLAEAMRAVNPLGRLSRGVAGIRGNAIICTTPGSPKGCVEQLAAIIDVLPHALGLLHGEQTTHETT